MANDLDAPKARKLSKRQRLFVMAYVSNGGNATEAFKATGYKGTRASRAGYLETRKPHVRNAITQLASEAFNVELLARAMHTLDHLAMEAASESVRLRAAEFIVSRSGLRGPEADIVRTPGQVVINLTYDPSKGQDMGPIDQTPEGGEGVEKSVMPHTPTPQPLTQEGDFEVISEE